MTSSTAVRRSRSTPTRSRRGPASSWLMTCSPRGERRRRPLDSLKRGKLLVERDRRFVIGQRRRVLHVAQVLHLRNREKPARAPGIPHNEREVTFLRAVRIPSQIVLGLPRLAVLVDAEQREIEVVARIGEVVRIAAEE